MAVFFSDAFESGDFTGGGWVAVEGFGWPAVVANDQGLDGGYIAKIDFFQAIRKDFSYKSFIYIQFKWKFFTHTPYENGRKIVCFTNNAQWHDLIQVVRNANNKIELHRGDNILATSADAYIDGTILTFDIYLLPHDTNGRCIIKSNGSTVIDFTGNTCAWGWLGEVERRIDRITFGYGTGTYCFGYLDSVKFEDEDWVSLKYNGNVTVTLTPSSITFKDPAGRYEGQVPVTLTPSSISFKDPVGVYEGDIRVALTPTADIVADRFYDGDVAVILGVEGEYFYDAPEIHSYIGHVELSLTPEASTRLDRAYQGNVPLTMGVASESEYIPPFVYEGHVSVSLGVIGEYQEIHTSVYAYEGNVTLKMCDGLQGDLFRDTLYAPIIPGRDIYSGFGVVDLTFLDADPPYYCVRDAIPIKFDPAAASVSLYAEYQHEMDGGLGVGGSMDLLVITPVSLEVILEGGAGVGGSCALTSTFPTTQVATCAGGAAVGGSFDLALVEPADAPVPTAIVLSGGASVSGSCFLEFSTPEVTALVSAGGVKVGGALALESILPTEMVAVVMRLPVALGVGGSLEVEEVKPPTDELPASIIAMKVGGEYALAFLNPPVLALVLNIALAIGGGDETPPPHETWALTGNNFNPSIYSGWDFNSYAHFHGLTYGAKDDGVYLLDGADDDGREIHSGIRIGPTNLGASKEKRLRAIHLEYEGTPTVRVSASDKESFASVEHGRASISREVQGREITIEISDFEKLSHLEIVPLVLARN